MRATPRAGRDAIEGIVTADDGRGRLSVKLAAAPSDGNANAALIALLAGAFAVPKRDVTLVSGATSRLKRLHIAGDAAVLAETLDGIIGKKTRT